jgi:hypothetical protein
MKTIFDNMYVSPTEYSYIIDITPTEKLQYLFELYDIELKKEDGGNLNSFFTTLNSIVDSDDETQPGLPDDNIDYQDPDRTDVMIDDQHIMIESNSLRSTRFMIQNFFETGYILKRDLRVEKLFRRDKITRYIRVYQIVGNISMMSFN